MRQRKSETAAEKQSLAVDLDSPPCPHRSGLHDHAQLDSNWLVSEHSIAVHCSKKGGTYNKGRTETNIFEVSNGKQ